MNSQDFYFPFINVSQRAEKEMERSEKRWRETGRKGGREEERKEEKKREEGGKGRRKKGEKEGRTEVFFLK